MSKYDWSNVDSDVEWIATDEDLNSWVLLQLVSRLLVVKMAMNGRAELLLIRVST